MAIVGGKSQLVWVSNTVPATLDKFNLYPEKIFYAEVCVKNNGKWVPCKVITQEN
jgi:hypothetical protein